MMNNILVVTGSVVVALSFLPYLIDTVKGKVKPRIATWISWSLITGIATVAAFSEGAYGSALLTGLTTIIELAVLITALRNGDREYQLIDGICQTLSVAGIVAWIISKNPVWAIAFNILADMFGAIPTLYHAWIAPHEEAYFSFLIFGGGAFLTVLGLGDYSVLNAAFPVYLTIIASSIGATIFFRQKAIKPAS